MNVSFAPSSPTFTQTGLTAAQNKHANVIEFLLERHAGIDVANMRRDTALHHAAFNYQLPLVALLLEHRADITPHGRYG